MVWKPDYCTAAELAAFMRIEDTLDDVTLASAISAASRSIDDWCNRQFGKTNTLEARYYTPMWYPEACRWVVEVDDFYTETGLLVSVDNDESAAYATPITEFRAKPFNAIQEGKPWTQIVIHSGGNQPNRYNNAGTVKVTASFGWSEVPTAIKNATLLQASRLVSRRDAPFGVAGSPTVGSEIRLLARLDPDVQVSINGYYRWWGAV